MLELRHITKSYEGQPLLRGVSFRVGPGETVCLLGRSGSGKSTLLRIVAGLEQAESGEVLWDGQSLAGTPVHLRRFGLMFQDYALFPHRSVRENVAFGLRMQGLGDDEIRRRVDEALGQVDLEGFGSRRVTDLSGGEAQRVALARALAPRPRLLMLDEPLGALDKTLREQLVEQLRLLLHHTGIPAIYVTHDQEEAFAVSDRLILLHEGRIEQEGTPADVYTRPVSTWAAQFLGLSNLLPAKVTSHNPLRLQTPLGTLESGCQADLPPLGADITLLLRPSGASLERENGATNQLEGVVEDVVFRGEAFRVTVELPGGHHFSFNLDGQPQVGQPVTLWMEPDAVLCLGE
jgi:ABC-type Fe3+/spermidine/putrescine transport system ATPase subunit